MRIAFETSAIAREATATLTMRRREGATLSASTGSARLAGPTREAALVGVAIGAIYLATMTGNHIEAEDALAYAAAIRGGAAVDVLNQNHLAWGALGWLFYN